MNPRPQGTYSGLFLSLFLPPNVQRNFIHFYRCPAGFKALSHLDLIARSSGLAGEHSRPLLLLLYDERGLFLSRSSNRSMFSATFIRSYWGYQAENCVNRVKRVGLIPCSLGNEEEEEERFNLIFGKLGTNYLDIMWHTLARLDCQHCNVVYRRYNSCVTHVWTTRLVEELNYFAVEEAMWPDGQLEWLLDQCMHSWYILYTYTRRALDLEKSAEHYDRTCPGRASTHEQ